MMLLRSAARQYIVLHPSLCCLVDGLLSPHPDHQDKHFDENQVYPINDAGAAGADPPAAGECAAQCFDELVRLAVLNTVGDHLQDPAHFCLAQGFEVLIAPR